MNFKISYFKGLRDLFSKCLGMDMAKTPLQEIKIPSSANETTPKEHSTTVITGANANISKVPLTEDGYFKK